MSKLFSQSNLAINLLLILLLGQISGTILISPLISKQNLDNNSNSKLENSKENLQTIENNVNSKYNDMNSNSSLLNYSQDYIKRSQDIKENRYSSNKPYGETGFGDPSSILNNDSLYLLSEKNLNTSNSFTNNTRVDSIVLENLSDFSLNSGVYSLSNITAETDHLVLDEWNIDWSEIRTRNQVNSEPRSVASEFTINEDNFNITSIQVIYNAFVQGFGNLTGELYITGISGGLPNGTVLGNEKISITENDSGSGQDFHIFNYSSPLNLPSGTYVIVLNDTTIVEAGGQRKYFRIAIIDDTGVNGDNEDNFQVWYHNQTNWFNQSIDLPFSVQFLALNSSDLSKSKKYSSPIEVNLAYNGTSVNSNNNNSLLTNGSILTFSSNISISFDLVYNLRFLGERLSIISYSINQNTFAMWNVTFNQSSVPSGNYQIYNRSIIMYSISTEWNATFIYKNDTIFVSNLEINSNITYSNGSSILEIKLASLLSENSWKVSFISPNYILSMSIVKNDSQQLDMPFKVNTTDILDISAMLLTTPDEMNGTLKIFDVNNNLNYTESNVSLSNNYLNFSSWDILSTLNSEDSLFGNYLITIIWEDSSKTKLGYIETLIEIIVQTNLKIQMETSIQYNNSIMLNASYSSVHNGTILNAAQVFYNTSWGDTGILSQIGSHTKYNGTLSTFNSTIGQAYIDVIAILPNYVNRTSRFNFNITGLPTVLEYQIINDTSFLISDIIEIDILYINLDFNTNLTSSQVFINGTNPINIVNDYYIFYFNVTSIDKDQENFILELSANEQYYQPQQQFIQINRTKATDLEVVIGENTGIIIQTTYQRTSIIGITWIDSQLSILINNSSLIIDKTNWLSFINQTDGIYYFNVTGINLNGTMAEINFVSPLYISKTLVLDLIVQQIPSDPIRGTFTQGVILSPLSSWLGYTMDLDLTWKISDNQSIIHDASWQFVIDGEIISNLNDFGTTIRNNSTINDDWTLKVATQFIPENNFLKGSYNFTIILSADGFKSQIFSFFIEIGGYDLKIGLDYSKDLIQGESFIIEAKITYSVKNLFDGNNNFSQILSEMYKVSYVLDYNLQSPINLDEFSAAGIVINFVIDLEYTNKTIYSFIGQSTTNPNGIALITIPAEYTIDLLTINSINITTDENSRSDSKQINDFTKNTIEILLPLSPFDIIAIIIAIIATIILSGIIMIFFFSYRSQKTKSKDLAEFSEYNLNFISNLATIIVTNDVGLPIYTHTNVKYLDNPNVRDLLGGHASSIDMFLDTFQSDFINKLVPTQSLRAQNNNSEPQIRTIEQDQLNILIGVSQTYRIFILSFIKAPNHFHITVKKIIREIERDIDASEGIVNRSLIQPQVEKIINHNFPISLLKTFMVDVGRLIALEKKIISIKSLGLSKPAINALKYLALMQSLSINYLPLSKDLQLKLFKQLVLENKLPGDSLIPMFFDEAVTLLKKFSQLSINVIYEALWVAGSSKTPIIIAYSVQ